MRLGMKQPEKIPYTGYDPSYTLMHPETCSCQFTGKRARLLPKCCYSFSLLPLGRYRAGKS